MCANAASISRDPRQDRQDRRWRLLYVPILLVAAALRLPAVTAGFPYLNYVDEGHVLHRTIHLLASGDWDPGWYIYGALPNYALAGAAALYAPVYRAVHGHPLRQGLSHDPPFHYNQVEPPELLLLARLLALGLALGSVLLVGMLAARLAGQAAGLFAAWLAALLPALVIRGGSVNVDVYALFFVLAALCFVERFRAAGEGKAEGSDHGDLGDLRQLGNPGDLGNLGNLIGAGAMCGLALVSKYPAVLVCLAVALAAVLAPGRRWRQRLALLAAAGGAAVAAALLGMPALLLKTGKVVHALAYEASLYGGTVAGSYWDQAVRKGEWDQPFYHPELGYVFLGCAAAGLAVGLLDPRLRRPVAGWLLFGAALGGVLAGYTFHPLRNLLPLIALACVLAAFLYARLRRAAAAGAAGKLPRGGLRGLRGRWGRWGPRAVDLAAVLLPVVLFAPDLADYVRHQATLVDSRRQAVDWLAGHAGPGDNVLVSAELLVLRSELQRLRADIAVFPWREARARLRKARFRFAAIGQLVLPGGRPIPQLAWQEILGRYDIRANFGEQTVAWSPDDMFHGNRETVYLLERKPGLPED
ncbi:MAG TPA: phospholipid carrier-dependent glycosyltransferase [Thermoanaerobaculia bacterium]|nr:phospholipid carrier-dependent glycosyltransferase [Thermoanaerobaculia bacterium]